MFFSSELVVINRAEHVSHDIWNTAVESEKNMLTENVFFIASSTLHMYW